MSTWWCTTVSYRRAGAGSAGVPACWLKIIYLVDEQQAGRLRSQHQAARQYVNRSYLASVHDSL